MEVTASNKEYPCSCRCVVPCVYMTVFVVVVVVVVVIVVDVVELPLLFSQLLLLLVLFFLHILYCFGDHYGTLANAKFPLKKRDV